MSTNELPANYAGLGLNQVRESGHYRSGGLEVGLLTQDDSIGFAGMPGANGTAVFLWDDQNPHRMQAP